MSAPHSGPASGSPSSGYYPDPSIPGYIRYWDGSAWVPGTSRPEPRAGEPLPAPPSDAPAAAEPAAAEEPGPVPSEDTSRTAGGSSGPHTARAGQGGMRVSWGAEQHDDTPPAAPESRPGPAGTAPEGTVQMRAMKPEDLNPRPAEDTSEQAAPDRGFPDHTVGLRRPDFPQQAGSGRPEQPAPGHRPVQPLPGQNPAPAAPVPPGRGVPPAGGPEGGTPSWARQVHDLAAPPAGPEASAGHPGMPQSQGPAPEGLIPWRPPVSDPFLEAAQQQARPAGLGKRICARAVDGLITGLVVGAVAFPLVTSSVEHIQQKMEAVEQSGETEQVWLIDGTTGGHLAVVLAVLVLFGMLYEVLPTVRWGRTLGKKLFGLQVLDVEQQSAPRFGPAAVRWLVHSGLWLVVAGIVNVVWGVFDRPWHQCWHDKVAHTFVAKEDAGVSL